MKASTLPFVFVSFTASLSVCTAQLPALDADRQTGRISENVRFDNTPLNDVLKVYAHLSQRTLLQHPTLQRGSFSLATTNSTFPQMIAAIEEMLHRANIATIRDGEKFVMLVPHSATNTISPRASELVSTSADMIPGGMIDFRNTPAEHVLRVYAEFTRQHQLNPDEIPPGSITFRTTTALTREEVVYGLETMFAWNGIRIVRQSDQTFEVLPVSGGRFLRRDIVR